MKHMDGSQTTRKQHLLSLSLMSTDCFTMGNHFLFLGLSFHIKNWKSTIADYWHALCEILKKSMNIHLGYTIASCSFLCWMDGWISLFWTRWKYFWNAPHHRFLFLVLFCWFFILFFFSINSPASCLYSCKLLAATILFQVSILNEEIVYTLPGRFSGCS